MDGEIKQLRVRFSDAGLEDQGRRDTITMPSQQSTSLGLMNNGDEYDAEHAATVAAVGYAIAALEEKSASQEKPISEKFASEYKPVTEKLRSQKKPKSTDNRPTIPPLNSTTKRDESIKRPTEGSKISGWFSGKEPIDDDYDDEQAADVTVRRPLKPAKEKPQSLSSDQKIIEKVAESASGIEKDSTSRRKTPERKGTRKFEQDQVEQKVPPAAPTAQPMSSYYGDSSRSYASRTTATSTEAEAMAHAWEKEKLAKIKKQYNETMETITEWETEKKAKARRQKELKDESESETKRAKALVEYNEEMSRINKVATASRLTADEKRRKAETKVREKADRIRSTGKLPLTCGCF
ncbi:hypothetical protein ACP4OV_027804 [Aristida adscensionis]